MILLPLYAIIDVEMLLARSIPLREFAEGLRAAGVELVQYRDKVGTVQQVLSGAAELRAAFSGPHATLIMNDRADLAALSGFGGVHVGQGDLSPEDARCVLGAEAIIGVSTHTDDQVRAAECSSADYVAIGPIFATGTKADAAPVVGLEGLRRARALTSKPLVAIGGITRGNSRSVIEAGADSVAVISGLFGAGEAVEKVARDFLHILG